MELRHLRYFVAAAEDLNFRRAAARLNIAQPALSVQIHQLEAEMKAQLFAREGRGVRLTEAGKVFLDQARKILASVNRGVALAQQAANGEIGHLNIGHNGPAELLIFPHVIPAFMKQWPRVHLTFENHRTPLQVERLRRDDIDIGFVWLPVPTDEFDTTELVQLPLVAVLPVDHPLARAETISFKDLSHQPMVLFSRARDVESFYQIERRFHDAGATMNIVSEIETLLSVLNFVAMGTGLTILPDYGHRVPFEGVVYRHLVPPKIVKTLAVIRKQTDNRLINAFHEFVLDAIPLLAKVGGG